MTAAQMKIEAWDAALKSVEHVLRCQTDNVKAIYRKAKVAINCVMPLKYHSQLP